MNKARVILIYMLIFMSLSSCSNRKYEQTITRADNLMELSQDSARSALAILDSIRPDLSKMGKSTQMRYQLVYAKGMNKGYVDFTTDSLMKEIVDYYDNHGTCQQQMLAHYLLGCVYRDLGDSPASLSCYNDAVEKVDTTSSDCDYKLLTKVYEQQGALFLSQSMPQNALSAYQKAEKYAWIAKDTLSAVLSYEHLGNIYEYMDNMNKVIEVYENASRRYRQYGYPVQAARALGGAIQALILTKQYAKAKKYMDVFEAESGYFQKDSCYSYINYSHYYYLKGLYCLESHSDSAKYWFTKCQEFAKTNNNKSFSAYAWYLYYIKHQQMDSVAKYSEQAFAYNDSANLDMERDLMQKMQAIYDYNRWKNVAHNEEIKATRANLTLLVSILVSVSVIIIGILTFLVYRKKRKLELQEKEEQENQIRQQIYYTKQELELLRTVNDRKIADVIKEKEQTINKLKEDLKDIRDKYSNSSLSDVDILLKESSIYKRIKYLELHPKETMRENDWIELEETIEQLIPSFIPLLKNRLNVMAYRICLLVKLEISTSSIAILLGLSSSAISKYRKVMLEKLCDRSGKPKDFDEYIRQIE
ncbi:tetratricopeptide repeat protein [Segatella copri]|jgi:tetratricopeptide (TPR) repeat protein|uniref:tetratricopeptide repeat protein n=1 Tax=Segatella copri TaxID=165179 RepID=UPI00336853DF